MKSFCFVIVLFIQTPLALWAQTTVADNPGHVFQVVREGIASSHTSDKPVSLQTGDMILTDRNSVLTIRLSQPPGHLMLGENTSVVLTSPPEASGAMFQLVFGRVRARTESLLSHSRIWITGHNITAGGVDFGCDQMAEGRPADRLTTVYSFNGSTDVYLFDPEDTTKTELAGMDSFSLHQGRMIRNTAAAGRLRSEETDGEIIEYWLGPGAAFLDKPGDISSTLHLYSPGYDKAEVYRNGGKAIFAAGVGMVTLGGLLRVFVPDNPVAKGMSNGILAVGGANIGIGSGMMTYSVSLSSQ